MAALSSMMRMRRMTKEAKLTTGMLQGNARQFEYEGGAASRPVTLGMQGAAKFLGCERATVQAEAVAGLTGGEAVSEQAVPVLGEDADTVVDDGDAHADRGAFYAQGDEFFGFTRFVACVLGVAHEIHQNLQHLVFIDGDRRHVAEFAPQRHAVAR